MTTRILIARLVPAVATLLLVGVGCLPALPPTPEAGVWSPSPGTDVNKNVNVETPVGGEPGTPGTDNNGASDIRIAGNTIVAFDQLPATSVRIGIVDADKPAFIVIRDGSYAVLGSSELLKEGESTQVSVPVSRSTNDGEVVYASLYADDGDGTFDSGDTIMNDWRGNPVSSTVLITVTAAEEPAPGAI